MRFTAAVTAFFAVATSAMPAPALVGRGDSTSSASCSRECMTSMVNQVLQSMLAHNPHTLPLARLYRATENSHAAALDMMTLWRTVTKAGPPSLLAIDTTVGSAYFSLDISEGSDALPSILWGRIKVVNKQIAELELYINRSRGDHGFSYSPEELPQTYARWSSPPANRTVATRAQLMSLSAATFNSNSTFQVDLASDCQFSEMGWRVVDPGPNMNGSFAELGCAWPDSRPIDLNARLNLVIDEVYGIVVTGAVVTGKVYPYGNESAFIPNQIVAAQQAQDQWIAATLVETNTSLLAPTPATGEVLQVLQYYNNELQGQQIQLLLAGPGEGSAWLQ